MMKQIARSPRDVGVAIRHARKTKKLNQSDVAALSGIWQETISRIENGQTGTKLETLFDIFAALDLELVVTDRSKGSDTDFGTIF